MSEFFEVLLVNLLTRLSELENAASSIDLELFFGEILFNPEGELEGLVGLARSSLSNLDDDC